MESPLIVVLMGSKSDWDVMRQADETLTNFGVPHECRVLSAHRTPVETAEYVSQAEQRGVEVVIAAAGGGAPPPRGWGGPTGPPGFRVAREGAPPKRGRFVLFPAQMTPAAPR